MGNMAATGADGLSLPEGPRSGHQAEWDAAMGTFERSERCLALKKWDNGLD